MLQARRENCVNTPPYHKTVAEYDAHTLFPVDTRSDKRTVRKKTYPQINYLFEKTVVHAFSEASFEEILATM